MKKMAALTISTEPARSETSCSTPEKCSEWAGYNRVTLQSDTPSLQTGYAVLAISVLFMAVGMYAILISVFVPSSGWKVLDVLASDTHYKYFAILLIPTTAYFVIANWVGWQYYRNS